MKAFTAKRQVDSEDELWIVEHPAVFTQGISGKAENLLQNSNIPVVQSDRGGQITYHGPGQLLVYCLIDLKRLSIGVKKMVSLIETAIMDLLKLYDIESQLKDGAPGVYVQGAKIAALGLKVKNGATYHGLSLNVDMDLSPFSQINPCGYQGLAVTQLSNLTDNSQLETVANKLTEILINHVARS
jgi:lipoyl(octanoyl) transferase